MNQLRDLLLYNLAMRGYVLTGVTYNECPIIPTDQLVIDVVRLLNEPRCVEGLAIVVDDDPPDYDKLVNNAIEYGIQNQVGYILEGTANVLKKYKPFNNYSELELAIEKLYQKRVKDDQFLIRLDIPNERESLSRNRQPEDIKWNILGGVTYRQFEIQYKIYNNIVDADENSKYKRRLVDTS